jgi:hypothetical protein
MNKTMATFMKGQTGRQLIRNQAAKREENYNSPCTGSGFSRSPFLTMACANWEAPERGNVIEMPLVGGLHHHYLRRAA